MANVGIVGLGYVGMQISLVAIRAGHMVAGYDTDWSVTKRLEQGEESHAGMSTGDISELFARGFIADSDPRVLERSDVILLCVPTPLGDHNGPNLAYLTAAAGAVSKHAKAGVLIVNESTSYPGTTRGLVQVLEAGLGPIDANFSLAFSSERVDPGRETPALTDITKVVGGVTENSTTRAVEFYQSIFSNVFQTSRAEEAEMSKLLENTYRQVNIALVNEMLRFSREMDIDLWESIDAAATKPFGFEVFKPGPGVGGHCIPIDPRYLSFHVKKTLGYSFRLVEAAQEINDSMPSYVVSRVSEILNQQGVPLSRAKILLIGLGYKAGVADLRESPSIPISSMLMSFGAEVYGYDPNISETQVCEMQVERLENTDPKENKADLAVVLNHFDDLDLSIILGMANRVLDTRGIFRNFPSDDVCCL